MGALGPGAWASEGGRPAAADRRLRGRRPRPTPTCRRRTSALFAREGELDRWLALADACWETRAFGDFWQHVLVAEGVIDVAVDRPRNAWDLAAPAPIVAEAGGRLTDLTGADTHDGGSALTSNGRVHAAALRLLGGPTPLLTRSLGPQ